MTSSLPPAILVIALAMAAPAAGQAPPMAADVTAEEIQAFVDALPRDAVSDRPIRVVDVGGYKVGVYGVFRPGDSEQRAVWHDSDVTEIYYILEGAGTLVTGGDMVDSEPLSGSSFGTEVGPGIDGGTSRRIEAGDVVIIPGRIPHWWSSLDGDLTYLIYRPDPSGIQTLR